MNWDVKKLNPLSIGNDSQNIMLKTASIAKHRNKQRTRFDLVDHYIFTDEL